MKTPAPLLLLALVAALPSLAAEPAAAPAERCDSAWLTAAKGITGQGGTPADGKGYLADEVLAGGAGSRKVVAIEKSPALCQEAVWRYLAAKGAGDAPLAWRDEGVKAAWSGGLDQQVRILLTVNDLYKAVDKEGAEALAKADAVVGEAAKLEDKSKAGPDELKAALTQILADKPAPKSKAKAKAAASVLVPGPAVLAYRKAVIALAAELGVRAAKRDSAAANGVDAKMKSDFSQPAGAAYAAPMMRVGKDGKAAYPDSVADDKGYEAALAYLTDPKITDAADAAAHESAALSRLDYPLRNALALRAAAVEQAVAAAKKRLSGRSVKETVAAVERDAAAAAAAKGEPKKGSMAADVLARLKETKEYSDLNSLYDNKSKADPKWAESEQGKAVAAQMETMRKDAAAVGVGKTSKGAPLFQYTIGGEKVTDAGIVVAQLNTDKEYRDFIAGAIATNISTDGKVKALLAALSGKGGTGDTTIAPPLTPEQKKTAGDLPPSEVKPAAPPSPWEALAKATPGAGFFGWFSSKETAERYAAHQHEAAAEDAAKSAQARREKERELNVKGAEDDRLAKDEEARRVAAAAAKAKADEDGIRQAPQDPDLDPAEAARLQKEAIAAREKAAAEEKAKIEAETKAKKAERDAKAAAELKAAQEKAAKAQAEYDAKMKALDETVDKAYTDGIAKSETQLHGDYKIPGNARRSAAERLSGYTDQFYRVGRVDEFFASTWEGDKLPAATASCKKSLNFKMPVLNGEGFKDPSADNVDGLCGVRDGLVAHLVSYRGKVKAPAPAPAAK